MISWCMYCQHFVREDEPFDQYGISHGICPACYAAERFLQPISADTRALVEFYRKLFQAGVRGELAEAEKIAQEAIAAGFNALDVALGFIQPGLQEIGAQWARGEITHHDEHRFTAWCNQLLSLIAPLAGPRKARPDLVIVQSPANRHMLGPNLAALALRGAGFDVRTVIPAVDDAELVGRILPLQPRAVGFSIAMPGMASKALRQVRVLQEAGFEGPVLFGGLACRGVAPPVDDPRIRGVKTVEEAAAWLAPLC